MDTTPTPSKSRHRVARLTLAASVLGGGALGAAATMAGAGAQETETTVVAEETENAERGAWVDEVFAQLVADGTLTQEQADATKSALQEARPEHPRGHGAKADLDELAATLGTDAETLRTQLRDGETIASIAEANGVDVQTVIDQMVLEATDRINEAVANGRFTQEEADEKLAELPDRITDRVNNGRPEGEGHRRGPGPRGEAPADAPESEG